GHDDRERTAGDERRRRARGPRGLVMDRRRFLAMCSLAATHAYADVRYPAVERGTVLAFPRDHRSHPAFRTEWWYVTGWVRDARERDFGIQVTFFRTRPGVAEQS